jgi:hypothetical protein
VLKVVHLPREVDLFCLEPVDDLVLAVASLENDLADPLLVLLADLDQLLSHL